MSWISDLAKGKAPKVTAGTAVDPLGIGLGKEVDKLLTPGKRPDLSAEDAAMEQAMQEYLASIEDYKNADLPEYKWLKDLQAEQLGNTELSKVSTNPAYGQYEQQALRDLEQISKDGMSATDLAQMAQLEADVNRQNRGRMGAIQQNMGARGMGGSGMELVAQMQAAQDATERQALASLEKASMAQQGRRDATSRLGNMATNLQGRDYNQAANAAMAQDRINQYNASQRTAANMYNNQGQQQQAGMNTGAQIAKQQNIPGMQQQGSQMAYNKQADSANRKMGTYQDKENQRVGTINTLLGAGGQAGAAAIASDERVKDNVKPEMDEGIEMFLKTIKPKSYNYKGDEKHKHGVVAQDLLQSKIGSDMVQQGEGGILEVNVNDAVGALLQAVAHLDKKIDRKGPV